MSNEKYELGVDYPPPGKKTPNLIGYVERDEEGNLWYSFESSLPGAKIAEENAKGNDKNVQKSTE